MRSPLTMLAGLPLLQLPPDVVPFPGCELRLLLLPETRGAIAFALGEESQRLVLMPRGDVGVIAELHAISSEPNNEVTLRPVCRIRRSTGLLVPEVEGINADDPLVVEVTRLARDFLQYGCRVRGWFHSGDSPTSIVDAVACYGGSFSTALRLQVLEALTWEARVEAVLPTLRQAIPLLHGQPSTKRDALVMEGMTPLEMAVQVAARMETAGVGDATLQQARRRLDLLVSRCSERDSGSAALLAYACSLPWENIVPPEVDIAEASRILDLAHFGADHIKRRVLEDIAIREHARTRGKVVAGPILCLIGEPGTGKTSLVRAIAEALKRPVARLPLGGVSEAHSLVGTPSHYRRSGPGRIIEGIRRGGSFAPVFLLDEIDKLGGGGNDSENGDPASALLALLDPEQQGTWSDAYLEIPTPLSHAIFIATANDPTALPAPLRDRLECWHLSGYSQADRLHIGRHALIPRVLDAYGLTSGEIAVDDEALMVLVDHDAESGVRQLRRNIELVVRRAAVLLHQRECPFVIGAHQAEEWLERPLQTRTPIGFRTAPTHLG